MESNVGPPPYQRVGGKLVSEAPSPMNRAARLMPSGPALGALLPPCWSDFTLLLHKSKPRRHRYERHKLFQVGSAASGEP